MSETSFVINDSLKKEDWDRFVYHNPNGNVFQTPEMFEVYKKTRRYEPIFLSVVDESDNILAGLLAVVIKEFNGFIGSFSARSIIQGGPLFLESEGGVTAASLLMQKYDEIAKRKALYTQIRMLHDAQPLSLLLKENDYVYEDHLNFLVDLTKTKEELWAGLSKSRRRFIRKAREKGVTVEEIKDRNIVSPFYDLLQNTYKNAKIPLADVSLFQSSFDLLTSKNLLKFFLAKYKDEYIGGIMTPIYKGVITEWYVTGSREHSKLYPSDMVSWYPIEWGSENGYRAFDFGGAGKPNEEYGVRDFKKQFGGKLVNYGRYTKVYSPLKMRIAEKGLSIYRKIIL